MYKKLIYSFVFVSALSIAAEAQTDRIVFNKKYFGIGIATPSATLHLMGSTADYNGYSLNIANSASKGLLQIRNDWEVYVGSEGLGYSSLFLRGGLNSNSTYGDFKISVGGYNGSLGIINNTASRYAMYIGGGSDASNSQNTFVTVGSTTNFASLGVYGRTNDANSYAFGVRNANSSNLLLVRNDGVSVLNGRLAVGDNISASDLYSYHLAVKGTIIAEGVVVKPYATWPDYVFAKTYRLLSLAEVDQYIKQHGHLPGMPSAKEVAEKKAVDLLDMNTRLLEKVEELYLHLIQKEKELQELRDRITVLENQSATKK